MHALMAPNDVTAGGAEGPFRKADWLMKPYFGKLRFLRFELSIAGVEASALLAPRRLCSCRR